MKTKNPNRMAKPTDKEEVLKLVQEAFIEERRKRRSKQIRRWKNTAKVLYHFSILTSSVLTIPLSLFTLLK